ncbi:MAG: hypothetical protein U0802_13540 [Candidatus Binatia bacterium]
MDPAEATQRAVKLDGLRPLSAYSTSAASSSRAAAASCDAQYRCSSVATGSVAGRVPAAAAARTRRMRPPARCTASGRRSKACGSCAAASGRNNCKPSSGDSRRASAIALRHSAASLAIGSAGSVESTSPAHSSAATCSIDARAASSTASCPA